jgi:hypothetical protein
MDKYGATNKERRAERKKDKNSLQGEEETKQSNVNIIVW